MHGPHPARHAAGALPTLHFRRPCAPASAPPATAVPTRPGSSTMPAGCAGAGCRWPAPARKAAPRAPVRGRPENTAATRPPPPAGPPTAGPRPAAMPQKHGRRPQGPHPASGASASTAPQAHAATKGQKLDEGGWEYEKRNGKATASRVSGAAMASRRMSIQPGHGGKPRIIGAHPGIALRTCTPSHPGAWAAPRRTPEQVRAHQ
jgi:hypothetical protein